MTKLKYLIAAMVALGLSGCASPFDIDDVYTLQATQAQGGTPFTRALTDEYRAQANDEANTEYEWGDAGWFARKGLQAANVRPIA